METQRVAGRWSWDWPTEEQPQSLGRRTRWEVHSHQLLDCVLLVVEIIGFLDCLSSRPVWRPLTLALHG